MTTTKHGAPLHNIFLVENNVAQMAAIRKTKRENEKKKRKTKK